MYDASTRSNAPQSRRVEPSSCRLALASRIRLAYCGFPVPPTASRLYRRLLIGSAEQWIPRRRLTTGDTADCQSALRVFAILMVVTGLGGFAPSAAAELRVPAFTAYVEPDDGAARVSADEGITGWAGSAQRVLWFGEIKQAGKLECSLKLHLAEGAESKLRLTVANQSREVLAKGASTNAVIVNFGAFDIPAPGYYRFTLKSLNLPGQKAGDLDCLILDGPAAQDAHFNLKERRNAPSVHLIYPTPDNANIEAFYCEVTAMDAPVWTFLMACGWHRGYFGMQVNSPTERRIIFSVWDSGKEASDREKVAAEDRVTLVAKGEGVYAGDFGNEGTGGHSHLVYAWRMGQPQRFIVTAKPVDQTHTIYSGYYFHPDKQRWMLISSWKTPKDGGYLRRLYSFSEDFGGANGHLRRKALYGNQWIRTADGQWQELTTATFSCDATGRGDRLDRFMQIALGQFLLSQGGFVLNSTKLGEAFHRPATGKPPSDIVLPELPQ